MTSLLEYFSGSLIYDIGNNSYNLAVVQPLLDSILFILVFVGIFVTWQIYVSSKKFKSKKFASCVEGIKFLCFGWITGTFLFTAALIAGVYTRIAYNYVFPISVSIIMLIVGFIAIFFMVKAMVAFSPPQIEHRRK